MKYLILALLVGMFVSVSLAQGPSPKNNPEFVIGSYRIIETTRIYPRPNYYDQILDCSGQPSPLNATGLGSSGSGATGAANGLSPILLQGSSGQDLNPGFGSGSGNLNNNSGSGPITLDTNNPGDGNATGSRISVGGLGGGGGYNGGNSMGSGYPNSSGGVTLEKIVNIGNIIWSLIDMGRVHTRVQTYRAFALPKGIGCWTDLENWQIPISKVFSVEYKNLVGKVIAVYSYRISFVYGGNVDGVGKFIANLTVTPVDLRVSWGFNFSSEVHIPATFNIGTRQNPIAGMQVYVFWNIGNSLKAETKSALYFVAGDGRVQLTEATK
jgi:hypothetical protein